MKIGFIFGSAKISGGSYVILQHALHLMKQGHSVDLITLEPVTIDQSEIWHDALTKVRFIELGKLNNLQYDIVLATWWISPFHLHKINAKQYAYFVQSIEAYFFDDSNIASQYLAHASYGLGLPVITEALWIKEDLEARFHSDVFLVENGIRKDIYKEQGPALAEKKPGRVRFLIEGAVTSPFKNIARTIDILRASMAEEVWLLTPTEISDYPHVDRVISNVPIQSVPEVYRSCDVLVKQSFVEGMFGPPLEMFHCGGTAIVSNVTGYDQYIENEQNALVTNIGSWHQIADAANRICSDQGLLERLKQGARRTAATWPDWPQQSALFEAALKEICQLPSVKRAQLSVATQHCLNQYGLIRDSLKSFYQLRSQPGLPVGEVSSQSEGSEESVGKRYFREQLAKPVLPATRLTVAPPIRRNDWSRATLKFKPTRDALCDARRNSPTQSKRVLGFSISNEHIEEMYHPVVLKAGWNALYVCTRPKGTFSLRHIDAPEVPDEDYIVSNWIDDSSLLFSMIEDFAPDLLLFHNGNHPAYQAVLKDVKDRFPNIPIAYSELGWFPQKGNIYFDPWGTNGASRLRSMSFEELTGKKLVTRSRKSDLHSNKVILALQLENDTNSLIFSPHFRSNRALIENVLASVPDGYDILIKAHPLDHTAHRYERFIGNRAKMVTDPISELLADAGSVIAINSTVLLEALDYQVNIYSCGTSILNNKGVAIEFDDSNLSQVWLNRYVDNSEGRRELKAALAEYQLNLETLDSLSEDEFLANSSIKVLTDLMDGTFVQDKKIDVADKPKSQNKIPRKGTRILIKSLREAMASMSKYDIVSFDVFDTLLVRDLFVPQDIFQYNAQSVAKLTGDSKFDHKKMRIEAERVARSFDPKGEVRLDEIYMHYLLASGLPADIVEEIKGLEVATELSFLRVRRSALELFNYAKSIRKKIVIISDFYLGSDFVRQALESAGYDLSGVAIYVSCEVNETKKHGGLYDLVAEELMVAPSRILHIGDNFHADATNGMSRGYDVIHVPSPRAGLDIAHSLKALLSLDERANLVGNRNLERSIVLGILNNWLFDDPFDVDLKTLFCAEHERFGYAMLGPLLAGFTLWLRKHVRSERIETLLFLARDGCVMEQAFRTYNEIVDDHIGVDAKYIAASRRITDIISYALDFDNINKAVSARFATGRLGNFLNLRFDLEESEISEKELNVAGYKSLDDLVTLPKDKVRVLKLLQTLRPRITEISVQYREKYLEYITEQGVDATSRIGVVDIGYFGTMQKTLNQIIGRTDEAIEGFYVATRGEARDDADLFNHMHGYLAHGFDLSDGLAPRITRNLAFLEQIFSAPHASISGFRLNRDGAQLEYMSSTGEAKQWKHLEAIHRGAVQFVRDLAELSARAGEEFNIERLDHSVYLAKLFDDANLEFAELFKDFVLENRYNGDALVLLGDQLAKKANPPKPSAKPAAGSAPSGLKERQYREYFNQGCAHYHRQQFESALKQYELALDLQPENANLRRVLAETLLDLNRRNEAIAHLKKAHKLAPDNKAIRRRLKHVKYPLLRLIAGGKPFPVPQVN